MSDTETHDEACPACNGLGSVVAMTPNPRSRYVSFDDLAPDDYSDTCPKCMGTGVNES